MRYVNCEDCGRLVPVERRVVSDDRGFPVVRLVVLAHMTTPMGAGRFDLCPGTGRDHAESQAVAA